jgi:hypothetical protein
VTRHRIAALAVLLLSVASGAPGACSPFDAAEENDAPTDGGGTSDGGSDAMGEGGGGAVDSGTFPDGAAAPCRGGAFGPVVPVMVADRSLVKSYRPWLQGNLAFGVSGAAQVFSVVIDNAGAPQGNTVAASNVLPTVPGFVTVNHAIATEDGLSLYMQGRLPDASDVNRLWVGTRDSAGDNNFRPATELPFIPGGVALEPWVLHNGKTLYFAGVPSGGSRELYVVERNAADDAWLEPVSLTPLKRSPDDGFPVVTQDELVVYYASTGANDDIWMSTRKSTMDDWDPPTTVPGLNSARDDRPTWISNDGCTLYFTSDRDTADTFKLYRAVRKL